MIPAPQRMITSDQRRKIFALYRDLGIGEDARHDVQQSHGGHVSLGDFTVTDAVRFIDYLERHAGAAPRKAPADVAPSRRGRASSNTGCGAGNRPTAKRKALPKHRAKGMALEAQQKIIAALFDMRSIDGAARITYSQRITGQPWVQDTVAAEALLMALMADGGAAALLERVKALRWSRELTVFERGFLFLNKRLPGSTETWDAAEHELKEYLHRANKRGRRTMPRISLTKLFEILEKYGS